MYFAHTIPFPDDGWGRDVGQWVLNKRFFTPIPTVGDARAGTPATMWYPMPNSIEDAAQYVIGARTGFKIPRHAQGFGSFGPDHKDHVRNDRPLPEGEEDWLTP